jgi:hypothetical protein
MIRTERYHLGLSEDWDEILEDSDMATFLHRRSYMDYHGDRFEDFSLVAFEQGRPMALLPANRSGDKMFSHQGLTYGGFVFRKGLSPKIQKDITHQMLAFLKAQGFKSLYLKPVPLLFAPGQILFNELSNGFEVELLGREITMAIPLPLKTETWNVDKRRGLRRAMDFGLQVEDSGTFEAFWNEILIPNLWERYKAKPVHSLEEISMLARKHPIRQLNVYKDSELLAGMTVYDMGEVVHVQYTSSSKKGRSLRALDYLVHQLCTEYYPDKKYLNLGTSHEQMGRVVKEGLFAWKKSYGSVPFEHEHYRVGFVSPPTP